MDSTAPPDNPDYLVIALAVGIPASVIIILLVVVISIMFFLMLRKSRAEEEIEAMYIRRRFQGLSLDDQKRMAAKRGRKASARRRSSAAESRKSGKSSTQLTQLTPTAKANKVMSANAFGLQEWQLKLKGIDIDMDTEETDIDGDEELTRNPMGAINPLMAQAAVDDADDEIDYEPVNKPPSRRTSQSKSKTSLPSKSKTSLPSKTSLHSKTSVPSKTSLHTKSSHSNKHVQLKTEESDSSDDSFNPYD